MTNGLKEGQLLHARTNFRFANPDKVGKPGKLASDFAAIAKPSPASGVEKWQVGFYNAVNKKGKEKGVGAWLQRQFGRPPAIYNDRLAEQSRLVMEKYLQDIGYFGAGIRMDTVQKDKKVTVNYTVTTKGQYFIREIYRPADTLPLTRILALRERETLLKKNRPYTAALLSGERSRLADIANENGYYEVTKDNFYYFVDTTAGELQADLYLRLKQTGDSSIYQVYYLGDSWVYPDYSLQRDTSGRAPDTIRFNSLTIVQTKKILRPTVLSRLIWQYDHAVFSKKEQTYTINRLLNLGIYKFADIHFETGLRKDTHFLHRSIFLTPGLMHDIGVEFQVNSRSGNFLGTEVSGSFAHKNLFHGAELFTISTTAGLETNIGPDTGPFVNTLGVGGSVGLGLPGIYAPFVKNRKIRGEYMPRTTFSIGDDYQQREGFFTLNSFNLSAGYTWQQSGWQHQFSPLFVNLVNTLKTSGRLDSLLAQNRRLRTSFEDVLILGLNYKVSRTNQSTAYRGRYFYWRGGFESAGNLLALGSSLAGGERPRKVTGVPFSQYVKFDSDFRQYFPLRKGLLAARFSFGVAYPYGNAEVLPYIKQYFIGGAGSVRAFRIRTLGPGSFRTKLDNNGSNFVDQTGDMKIELNLEYRFPIFSYLKGAVFTDAGNIWLTRGDADESTPEAEGLFKLNRFYREMAVGTGLGLRVDFGVAVVRLDWAFPLRKPYETDGSQWLFSELHFLNGKWRKENVVWNIAIGYPF
ncbi:MAG: BamA/TamA family outer membrane protein [Saprospiraceae bacterium]|nr:BamA/TamA family outer membrane protein [Saprospiraceae bacterium]